MAGEDPAGADAADADPGGGPAVDFSRARADATVAGGAAAATVALTLALRFGPTTAATPVFVRLSPLAVYAAYLGSRRLRPPDRFARPRYWVLLSFVVAGAVLATAL